ncbi:MAG: endonuclease/exonuclease/phosphatase family protein [Planctomycetes bacterium]|nr:endonuclease/exonuclease/phosphatase family protein [Planctomycetota bacterium]
MIGVKGIRRRGIGILLLALGSGCASPGTEIRILSYEIGGGGRPEEEREQVKGAAAEEIRILRPDLLATQGASTEEVDFLRGSLPDYACGPDKPPGFAVFWRKDRVERLGGGLIPDLDLPERPNLPEQPDPPEQPQPLEPSSAPHASWTRFRLVGGGDAEGPEILLVNVHMGDRTAREREDLAQDLRDWLRGKSNHAVIAVAGGFHDTPLSGAFYALTEADEGSKAFANALGGSAPPFLVDAWAAAATRRGPSFTYRPDAAALGARFDWILVSPRIRVRRAETVPIPRTEAETAGHSFILADLLLPSTDLPSTHLPSTD